MRCRRGDNQLEQGAVGLPAMVLTPGHLAGVGAKVLLPDAVMHAEFGAA